MAFEQAYGLYLMNGGTPEGFDNLTTEDVQIMYSAYIGTMTNMRREIIKDLIKIFQKMFGG